MLRIGGDDRLELDERLVRLVLREVNAAEPHAGVASIGRELQRLAKALALHVRWINRRCKYSKKTAEPSL